MQAAARDEAFVLFEAPHRIDRTAHELSTVLAPQRRVVLARELTKMFEAVIQTTAERLVEAVSRQGERGEFVVLVDGPAAAQPAQAGLDEAAQRWLQALARELPAARVAAVISQVTGVARQQVYAAVLQAQGADKART